MPKTSSSARWDEPERILTGPTRRVLAFEAAWVIYAVKKHESSASFYGLFAFEEIQPRIFRPEKDESSQSHRYATHEAQITAWATAAEINLAVVESDYVDRAFLASYDTQHSRAFGSQCRRCERFILFRVSDEGILKRALAERDTLAAIDLLYESSRGSKPSVSALGAVVRRPITNYLGRSYFSVRLSQPAHLLRGKAALLGTGVATMNKPVHLAGRRFVISACVPFISQDGYAAACASAAAWMALEIQTCGEHRDLTPAALTRAAHERHPDRGLYARGLSAGQLALAIQAVGLQPLVTDPSHRETWSLTLSWMLDSKIPCVLGLTYLDSKADYHAVTVVGQQQMSKRKGKGPWWGEVASNFVVLDDSTGPFILMRFLRGSERAAVEAIHRSTLHRRALSADGLVIFEHGEKRMAAVLQTLVAAVPPAIEPIRQNLSQEAPGHALRAATVLINGYRNRDPETLEELEDPTSRMLENFRHAHETLERDFPGEGDLANPLKRAAFVRRLFKELKAEPNILGFSGDERRSVCRALVRDLYRSVPYLLDGGRRGAKMHLSKHYLLRAFLIGSVAYKSWLSGEGAEGRPPALRYELRNLPMPEFIWVQLFWNRRKALFFNGIAPVAQAEGRNRRAR